MGKYLRRRYDKLIGPEYSHKNVYIRSSDTDRTIMSALCNSAGLFPPAEKDVWMSNLDWQPIPIHTVALNEDYLIYQAIPCNKSDKLSKEIIESVELYEKYSNLMKYIEKQSGSKMRTIMDLNDVYNSLFIEKLIGLP